MQTSTTLIHLGCIINGIHVYRQPSPAQKPPDCRSTPSITTAIPSSRVAAEPWVPSIEEIPNEEASKTCQVGREQCHGGHVNRNSLRHGPSKLARIDTEAWACRQFKDHSLQIRFRHFSLLTWKRTFDGPLHVRQWDQASEFCTGVPIDRENQWNISHSLSAVEGLEVPRLSSKGSSEGFEHCSICLYLGVVPPALVCFRGSKGWDAKNLSHINVNMRLVWGLSSLFPLREKCWLYSAAHTQNSERRIFASAKVV